jgi:cytosine/adenosine deaminase-related metal-dependent hydrolase
MAHSDTLAVHARWLVCSPEEVLEDAVLLVRNGRVERIARGRMRVPGARVVDARDAVVAAGMVNAHAHLELGALAGQTPRGGDFAAWVRKVIELRAALRPRELARAAREGAARALASGTTCVLDIDTTGAAFEGLRAHPIRAVSLREVLDAQDPTRTAGALARLARALPRRARVREGVSPHAPFTVSPALLAGVARIARRRRLPVQMHWSETEAEVEWMAAGTGPLARMLGPSPRASALDLLERVGLFGPELSLVHGNWPQPGEARRLARSGVTLVHCPGSHAWFEREPFPWREYRRAGVEIALGTDSLASNEDLDLRRELRLAWRAAPWLAPAELWRAATSAGAAACGERGRLGCLRPGSAADFWVLPVVPNSRKAVLEALCGEESAPRSVWVGGRCVVGR